VSTEPQAGPGARRLSRGLVVLFAVATGQAVASNYLAQPLLDDIRRHFETSAGLAGLIVTVSQVGYAVGLVLLLPLGDLLERRRLITSLAGVTALLLAAAAFAPSLGLFMALAGLIGFTSVMAQILVPFAAGLSPEAERGRVVGTVMSGLLLGILLARTASGLVAQVAGWRAVYVVAAAAMAVQALVLLRGLPTWRRPVALSYPRLLASVLSIARAEPVLRWRAVYGALSFGAFSVLWTTLAFLLSGPPYRYGAGTIGLFGLVGAAGAAAASFAGRLSDRGWRDRLTGGTSLLMLVAYGLIWRGAGSLAALIAGIVVLDVGAQAIHITNQGEIYRLQPEARSRINAFYMVSCFTGAAAGSATASLAYASAGWAGVCLLGACFGAASLAWWGVELARRADARGRPVGTRAARQSSRNSGRR
jgi:predicted MFS family arabinose efflux permease